MPLPVTTACPVGPAGTATAWPSPVGAIFSPGPACCSRTFCAIRKLADKITQRKTRNLTFPRGANMLTSLVRDLRSVGRTNRRSRKLYEWAFETALHEPISRLAGVPEVYSFG